MTAETKTATQQAAAELRNIAADIEQAHAIDGDWGCELEAKAEHDHVLFLADIIEREEKSRLAEERLLVEALKSVYRAVHDTKPQPRQHDDFSEDIARTHDYALQQIAAIVEMILGESGTGLDLPHTGVIHRPGHDALWDWFSLSYAGWLTLPRVLMHEMPDHWQALMAALLRQWDGAWSIGLDFAPEVVLKKKGRIVQTPDWITNYRHPRREDIDAVRRGS